MDSHVPVQMVALSVHHDPSWHPAIHKYTSPEASMRQFYWQAYRNQLIETEALSPVLLHAAGSLPVELGGHLLGRICGPVNRAICCSPIKLTLVWGGALQRHTVCSHADYIVAMPACICCKAGFRSAAQAFAGEAQAASRSMQCGQRDLYACPVLDHDRGQDCFVVKDGRRQDSKGRVRCRCRV